MLPARLHFSFWGVTLPIMKSVGSVTKLNYHSVNQSSFVSWLTEVKEEQTELAFLGKCCDLMFFHFFFLSSRRSVTCLPSKFSITLWKSFVRFSFTKDKMTNGRDKWDDNNILKGDRGSKIFLPFLCRITVAPPRNNLHRPAFPPQTASKLQHSLRCPGAMASGAPRCPLPSCVSGVQTFHNLPTERKSRDAWLLFIFKHIPTHSTKDCYFAQPISHLTVLQTWDNFKPATRNVWYYSAEQFQLCYHINLNN